MRRVLGIRTSRRHLLLWSLVLAVVIATVMQTSTVLGQVATGATLTVLRGTTSVVRSDGSAVQPASTGLTLNAGDRVATVGRASALVTFFDGSEVELGADTTIRIQEMDSRSGGQINILLENVLGSTVHRVATLANPGSSYQIVSGGSVALVRGTVIGFRTDPSGNVIVYLVSANNIVTFPYAGHQMYAGQVCVYTAGGDLLCGTALSGDIWSTLANGDNPGGGNEKPKPLPKDDNVLTATTTVNGSTTTSTTTTVITTTVITTTSGSTTSEDTE